MSTAVSDPYAESDDPYAESDDGKAAGDWAHALTPPVSLYAGSEEYPGNAGYAASAPPQCAAPPQPCQENGTALSQPPPLPARPPRARFQLFAGTAVAPPAAVLSVFPGLKASPMQRFILRCSHLLYVLHLACHTAQLAVIIWVCTSACVLLWFDQLCYEDGSAKCTCAIFQEGRVTAGPVNGCVETPYNHDLDALLWCAPQAEAGTATTIDFLCTYIPDAPAPLAYWRASLIFHTTASFLFTGVLGTALLIMNGFRFDDVIKQERSMRWLDLTAQMTHPMAWNAFVLNPVSWSCMVEYRLYRNTTRGLADLLVLLLVQLPTLVIPLYFIGYRLSETTLDNQLLVILTAFVMMGYLYFFLYHLLIQPRFSIDQRMLHFDKYGAVLTNVWTNPQELRPAADPWSDPNMLDRLMARVQDLQHRLKLDQLILVATSCVAVYAMYIGWQFILQGIDIIRFQQSCWADNQQLFFDVAPECFCTIAAGSTEQDSAACYEHFFPSGWLSQASLSCVTNPSDVGYVDDPAYCKFSLEMSPSWSLYPFMMAVHLGWTALFRTGIAPALFLLGVFFHPCQQRHRNCPVWTLGVLALLDHPLTVFCWLCSLLGRHDTYLLILDESRVPHPRFAWVRYYWVDVLTFVVPLILGATDPTSVGQIAVSLVGILVGWHKVRDAFVHSRQAVRDSRPAAVTDDKSGSGTTAQPSAIIEMPAAAAAPPSLQLMTLPSSP